MAPFANGIALTIVVVGLTYFTVVVGELVPKRLGLLAPEKVASFIAPTMNMLSRVAHPLVWLLSASSGFLLRVAGAVRKPEPPVTDDEIKMMMAEGAEAGVFHVSERAIVANVLRLDEQHISAIMTHRNDIYTLDLEQPEAVIRQRIAASPYTRVVVCRGGLDNIVGILRITDLLKDVMAGQPIELEKSLRSPLFVPDGVSVTHLLENFRKARRQSAMIVDEYGELQGMVTLTDVMVAIVGDIPSSDIVEEQDIIVRQDHSWLIDGSVSIERLKTVIKIETALPGEEEHSFNTLGGFMMHMLDRIPAASDYFEASGFRFEVVDMDKKRVDKVLVKHIDLP